MGEKEGDVSRKKRRDKKYLLYSLREWKEKENVG